MIFIIKISALKISAKKIEHLAQFSNLIFHNKFICKNKINVYLNIKYLYI